MTTIIKTSEIELTTFHSSQNPNTKVEKDERIMNITNQTILSEGRDLLEEERKEAPPKIKKTYSTIYTFERDHIEATLCGHSIHDPAWVKKVTHEVAQFFFNDMIDPLEVSSEDIAFVKTLLPPKSAICFFEEPDARGDITKDEIAGTYGIDPSFISDQMVRDCNNYHYLISDPRTRKLTTSKTCPYPIVSQRDLLKYYNQN